MKNKKLIILLFLLILGMPILVKAEDELSVDYFSFIDVVGYKPFHHMTNSY